MSPSVGTLSSTGLYTPPGSVASPTTITVTATNTVDTAIAGQVTLVVFPAGPIRIVPGSLPGVYTGTMNPTDYTDTGGDVWYSIGDDGGYGYDQGMNISGTSDPILYRYEFGGYGSNSQDVRFDFIVPNSTYQVLFKGASTVGTLGTQIQDLEVNGTIVYPDLDLYSVSGGLDIAWDWSTSVNVTDNKLSFVLRIVNSAGAI